MYNCTCIKWWDSELEERGEMFVAWMKCCNQSLSWKTVPLLPTVAL